MGSLLHCSQCGEANEKTASHCSSCGAPFVPEAPKAPIEEIPQDSIKRLAILTCKILVIVGVCFIIFIGIVYPNYIEYQTASKVAKTKSNLRTLATAIESYFIDARTYPVPNWEPNPSWFHVYEVLTTPIAYINWLPRDPFASAKKNGSHQYSYGAGKEGEGYSWREWPTPDVYPCDTWLLDGLGPERTRFSANGKLATHLYPWPNIDIAHEEELLGSIYNPTNGTISNGQIFRCGGVPIKRPPIDIWWNCISMW